MVTKDWIGSHLSKGKDFLPLARKAMAMPIGDVYYVDLAAGSDSGDGESWDVAYKTINFAYDQVGSDSNDYILVRGYAANAVAAITATLDVGYTHLIGHAGLMNPYFPEKGSLYRSAAFDGPFVLLDHEFIEVAGFSINAVQGGGTEGSSVSKGALRISSYSGATSAANKAYVHNCHFPDWNSGTTVTGMTIVGAHYPVVHDIYVDSVYGNINSGIYISGASGSNASLGDFRGLHFRGTVGGALTTGVKLYSGSSLQNSTFKGITHTRGTNMVNFGSDYGSYCSFDYLYGDMTEANAFTGGTDPSARNVLWTYMKSTVGPNTYFRDAAFTDT